MSHNRLVLIAVLLVYFSTNCHAPLHAQTAVNQPVPTSAAVSTVAVSSAATTKDASVPLSDFLRRIQFLSADSVTQVRYMDANPGKVTARDQYYKLSTRVQISLLGEGTTYLQARGEAGRNFISSYDYTGLGLHQPSWSFNLKSLYLGQKMGKHLEAQVGGIEFDQGVGTEATYSDNDAWLEGYRMNVAGRSRRFPDKVSVTGRVRGRLLPA